ncbi:kinase-like domain-containing protein [Mycena metata]|uniref:Kinase-like domain-containing protein n=1 Tax=Mycena metata TaxID=1033252 RepID=A0AAD7JAW3_9AGAR|nr:kinase-like domain-containing protein [Mycena metata]
MKKSVKSLGPDPVVTREKPRETTVVKLTNDLASLGRVSASSLSSFLDECCAQRERLLRLWQIAAEVGIGVINRELVEDAIWEGNLIILAVFHEILTSKADLDDLARLQGDSVQFVLDLIQDAIRTHQDFFHILVGGAPRLRGTRKAVLNKIRSRGLLGNFNRPSAPLDARRLLIKLSITSDLLPSALIISGITERSKDPVFGGSFGDVYRAQHRGRPVAVKRLRFFEADGAEQSQTRKEFFREALIWKNVDHEYILPFLGVDPETFPGFLCMVSPWMTRGTIVNKRSGGPPMHAVPRLVYEIAKGLQYLHSQDIVHGDLKAANILIDDDNHVRLADFGMTRFPHTENASSDRGGSTRWTAPELLHPPSCGLYVYERTPASDIYSFGCVLLELYTEQPPFFDIRADAAVMLKVIQGERPTCPTFMHEWARALATECWSHIPINRPGTGAIIEAAVQVIRDQRHIQSSESSVPLTLPTLISSHGQPILVPAPWRKPGSDGVRPGRGKILPLHKGSSINKSNPFSSLF